MRLFITLKDNSLIDPSKVGPNIVFKKGNTGYIDLVFLDETTGVQTELASGATAQLGLKVPNTFDGSYIVYSNAFTKVGSGSGAVYRGTPNFATAELAALLPSGTPRVKLTLEVGWTESGRLTLSQDVDVWAENSLLLAGSGPTPSLPVYPTAPVAETLLGGSDDGLSWVQRTFAEVWAKIVELVTPATIRADIGLVETAFADLAALRAAPTEGGATATRAIREVVTGTVAGGDVAITRWILLVGSNADDGVSYVRPNDYTNRIYVRIGG